MTKPIRAGTRCVSTMLPVAATLLTAGAATAQETSPAAEGVALDLDVVAKQLDIARTEIQPSLGATVYQFGRQAIETQPQGDNQPFNQLILQAPGVAQDSFGQLHIRGDHANIQFRINGVQLPEGINVFGQSLQTRLANSVALITGALPAQYGLRTAGVIDIQTKTGTLNPGGSLTMYGGSQATIYPSAEWGGRVGQIDYYATGEYLQNAEGIENPAPTPNAIHDHSQQPKGFAYVSGIIDPTSRLTVMLGASRGQFQIPQVGGQTPALGLTVNGISDFASAMLNENQRQINNFGILAWQKRVGDFDFQVAGYSRYSDAYFSPGNPVGDLLFNGIAQTAYRQSWASGVQGDGAWRISPEHTVRSGFLVQRERSPFSTTSNVLPIDENGVQTSEVPLSIFDSGSKTGWLYSYYLQDEWKIIPGVTLNFGARYDQFAQFVSERQLSPRVNVVWQPTETTTLNAGYSRYFVPPPFELIAATDIGLLANTTGAPPGTQNNVAKAERDHYFDVGASQIILPGLKAGIDAYYKIASNLLDEGQFGAPILFTPFNYQKGLLKGVELTLTYDIDNWSFYGNLAASQNLGKNITSAQFNFAPEELAFIAGHYIHTDHDQTYTSSAGIKYTLPTSSTRFAADLIQGSGLRTAGTVPNGRSLPGYQQVNFSIVQPIPTGVFKGMELRFDVINLFDEIYQIRTGQGLGVFAPQFGPRRTFLAGLTQRF
ncbi:MAG TPA: TonB-dependent receptor [Stellaceae bacterium]|jgi:outer membrane receptor protein involved in Fe transport|nr:TonB-dependent receptor [Stellaceae bacterium]